MFRSNELDRDFRIAFGSQSDGDPVVMLADSVFPYRGNTFALEGAESTCRLYELVWDPSTQKASLWVS